MEDYGGIESTEPPLTVSSSGDNSVNQTEALNISSIPQTFEQIPFENAALPSHLPVYTEITATALQNVNSVTCNISLPQLEGQPHHLLPVAITTIGLPIDPQILQLAPNTLTPGTMLLPDQQPELVEKLPLVPILSAISTDMPRIVNCMPVGMIGQPLTSVASASSDTYLTSQYFLNSSKGQNLDLSENVGHTAMDQDSTNINSLQTGSVSHINGDIENAQDVTNHEPPVDTLKTDDIETVGSDGTDNECTDNSTQNQNDPDIIEKIGFIVLNKKLSAESTPKDIMKSDDTQVEDKMELKSKKENEEQAINDDTDYECVDKVKQSQFLTTCELKEANEEEESSRDSLVETKDVVKSDEKINKGADTVDNEEAEFIWEKHLEETGSVSVPPTAFKHVEYSLESGFVKGMKLEVPNKCNTDTYWVASVLMTCGPLLRLRFDGYEDDNSSDFWCDLMTSEIHPIGWCAQNNQILQPPEAIKDKFDDWRDFLVRSLTGARTAPSYLLDKSTGITPIDQLKQGMRLELQHPINPLEVWIVKILENVGGRLYLRFEGVETATHDFWLFYLNHRLHPIGWAKMHGFKYQPPKELISEDCETVWKEVSKTALKEAEKFVLPLAIFKDQEEVNEHRFEKGWKLEALNPINKTQICPATVLYVLNSRYFVVEIDDLENKEEMCRIRFSCYSGSKCIFPTKWCRSKGINVTPPNGWPKSTLSWEDYLKYCKAEAAPNSCFPERKFEQDIEPGMKFEAVNPENPNQICVATISRVFEPLLWIHLDSIPLYGSSHIEHFESHNLFPVGWCESNGYQLKTPVMVKKKSAVLSEITDSTNEVFHSKQGGEWCNKVYYNHHCFSGPHLSKSRIASLPKCVGPGPIFLVMKEVLSMLINVAYKPCRVLKELQLEGRPNPDMYQQILKAKYKGKSYRAVVEIIQHADKLPEFCRKICTKLECCPNLISQTFINGECPEKCSQLTKTQYTYYNPKKKVGRPPGGHTNLENGPKKPGKKKKKKRMKILTQGETNTEENGSIVDGDEDKESVTSDTKTNDSGENLYNGDKTLKRKYVHHIPLPSDIKTRGAKLPKYSFERKTHKKIPVQDKHHIHTKPHKKHHVKEEKQTSPHNSPVKNAMKLSSNPLHWSVQEVVGFIKGTECAPVARLFREQEIDGQALLLLTLPTVQEYLELKLGPAIKLCHHIEQIKLAFFQQYAK
ncbi:Scm-like with four MBT domains protein 1,Scm-like with four MBT domains protein 2 [Mytilus coruscus]|uniref:Scm-like with four MBT domains protein 1,Scm-like with four MBT domains protein 2 n=1 Tax=Mytilus coruscus TaxID=42192 RepID=A0A6J8DF25_MYTCO|nr:Scm-like with four MBT domains protein 1,Scm-like with four MBT domains protein 2 [Mytilus coruscus]